MASSFTVTLSRSAIMLSIIVQWALALPTSVGPRQSSIIPSYVIEYGSQPLALRVAEIR